MENAPTLQRYTNAALAALAAVTMASIYVLWRSLDVIGGALDPFSGETQDAEHGIKLTYGAMTVLWPLVVGFFAFTAAYLLQRRCEFLSSCKDDVEGLQARDLLGELHTDSKVAAILARRPRLVAQLPTFALVANTIAPLVRLVEVALGPDASDTGGPPTPIGMAHTSVSSAVIPDGFLYLLSLITVVYAWRLARTLPDAWNRFGPFAPLPTPPET